MAVDYHAGARGSARNVRDRDLQPWHWRLSAAFGSRCVHNLWIRETVEELQHFDSKAYWFVTCSFNFPLIDSPLAICWEIGWLEVHTFEDWIS